MLFQEAANNIRLIGFKSNHRSSMSMCRPPTFYSTFISLLLVFFRSNLGNATSSTQAKQFRVAFVLFCLLENNITFRYFGQLHSTIERIELIIMRCCLWIFVFFFVVVVEIIEIERYWNDMMRRGEQQM